VTGEQDLSYAFNRYWTVTGGLRIDELKPYFVTNSPDLNQNGKRADVAVRVDFNSQKDWGAHAFAQTTIARSGARRANNRVGLGAFVRWNEANLISLEGSWGNLGPGGKIGFERKANDARTLYANYAYDPDRLNIVERGGLGSFVAGGRQQYSDSFTAFGEERYRMGAGYGGMTHGYGFDYTPAAGWKTGLKFETGRLIDPFAGAIARTAISPAVSYSANDISYNGRLEFRWDKTQMAYAGAFSP
jgi:hypothetical protein